MAGLLAGLADLLGRGPAAGLLGLLALALVALPVVTWARRGRWRRLDARVEAVAPRRSLATGAWTVEIAYEAGHGTGSERRASVPVNLQRHPLSPGDRLAVLVDPDRPGRVASSRWQGAATPWMIAPLVALAAFGLLRG